MSSLFMRGDPFDFSIAYYVIGRKDGIYYYYTSNVNTSSNVKANMVSVPYGSLKGVVSPIQLTIKKEGSPNLYSFKGGASYYPLVVSSSNIIDISSTSSSSQIFVLVANNAFGGDASNLYPGVWYSFYINNTNVDALWYAEPCNSQDKKPFCNTSTNNGITSSNMEIMFIPQNVLDNGQLGKNTIVKWGTKNGVNSCLYDSLNIDIGLVWFQNYITNNTSEKTIGCEGGYVNSLSYNCYFTNNSICENGYLYTICANSDECGNCMGICDIDSENNMKPCLYDFNVSSSSSSSFGGGGGEETQLSCNPKTPDAPTNSQYFILIIIIIILFFIIIGAAIFFGYKTYKMKNNDDDEKT